MAISFLRGLLALGLGLGMTCLPAAANAQAGGAKVGIVLMHGKGGSPTGHVAALARELAAQGVLVANLDMPWSGRRNYDVPVPAAQAEVEAALQNLRSQGAQKLFVAGHSQGGVFALYLGTRLKLDGVIAIAPGGNVANPIYAEKLGAYLAQARRLVAEGRGEETSQLADYEGSKGTYAVQTTPKAYVSWFDPDGAMNQLKSSRAMVPATPVLYVAPSNDYPGLIKVKHSMFSALPKNATTKMYEPQASHTGAPTASAQEILAWMQVVAKMP